MTTEAKFKYALKEMMLTKPLSEINVTLLCEKCSCHRQTFYYHYQDIYDLLAAIFLNEQIKGLDEANTVEDTLSCFLSYSKENFVFLRSTYNSAAYDLVDDLFYSKIMTKLFSIFCKSKPNGLSKEGCRSLARRYSKLVSDEFGFWFRNVSVTPARFEKTLKRFISNSIATVLPSLVTLSSEENKK